MKRIMFCLLIIGLLITMPVLAACGGKKETTTPLTTTTEPPTTTTTEPPTTTTTEPPTTETITRDELPTTYQYTIVFSSSDGSSGTYEVWVKGGKVRLEMTVKDPGGEETIMIIIVSEGYDYWYMPEENMAIRYPSDSAMSPAAFANVLGDIFTQYYTVYVSDALILAEFEYACDADLNCQSVSIVGHETILGEECTIFEVLFADGTKLRIWLATNKGYVLKVETITAEGTMTIEFTEIDLIPSIPDSMFELPEGVEIMDMPGI